MKRDSPDEASIPGPNCLGTISGFFCPPTNITSTSSFSSGDVFIQTEIDRLSPSEQEKIFQDLYGFDVSAGKMEDDDPGLIETKLKDLDIEISSLKSKRAYEEAKAFCPAYVERTKLMFLRADLYDVPKASRRLVKHWAKKVELFGFDRAMKGTIKQVDLDDADLESIASGGLQVLPEKDRAGRTLFWGRRECFRYREVENLLRTLWYLIMAQLETDEDSQRNGWVAIVYNVGHYHWEYFDREMYSQYLKIVKLLPFRIVGYHSCFNDLKLRTVTPFTFLFMGKELRARFRSHVGAHAECLFELMTYGIPLAALPVTMDGSFDFRSHHEWMEKMRLNEQRFIVND